jgi:O-antigen/teichoic acid export membrane protein
MNTALISLKLRNKPLSVLMGGQGLVALANLVYGKAVALYISPIEWGQYSVLLAVMLLLHSLMVTPTIQSFKAELTSSDYQRVVNFYGRILGVIYIGVFALMAIGAVIYTHNIIWVLVWIASVAQGIYSLSNDSLNFAGKHKIYSLLLIGYSFFNLLLFGTVVWGFGQNKAINLWQILALLNGVFAVVSVWQAIRLINGFRFDYQAFADWFPTELLRKYQHYIWPLTSLAVWSWLINYADRYLIRFYMTDADIGQYTLGYGIGSKMLIVVAPLISFLTPLIFQLKADSKPSKEVDKLLRHYLKRYILIAGGICIVFWATYRWVGLLLLSITYKPAFVIGPIVASGYLFLTCIHILEIKWYAYGLTRFVLWHNSVGAIINVILNIILIPRLGIVGAALATLLGFAGQFLIVLWLFQYDAKS